MARLAAEPAVSAETLDSGMYFFISNSGFHLKLIVAGWIAVKRRFLRQNRELARYVE